MLNRRRQAEVSKMTLQDFHKHSTARLAIEGDWLLSDLEHHLCRMFHVVEIVGIKNRYEAGVAWNNNFLFVRRCYGRTGHNSRQWRFRGWLQLIFFAILNLFWMLKLLSISIRLNALQKWPLLTFKIIHVFLDNWGRCCCDVVKRRPGSLYNFSVWTVNPKCTHWEHFWGSGDWQLIAVNLHNKSTKEKIYTSKIPPKCKIFFCTNLFNYEVFLLQMTSQFWSWIYISSLAYKMKR